MLNKIRDINKLPAIGPEKRSLLTSDASKLWYLQSQAIELLTVC